MHRPTFLQRLGIAAASYAVPPLLTRAADQAVARAPAKAATAGPDVIADLERTVLWNGRKSGKTWFHPRACLVPPPPGPDRPVVLMTLQEITGSDVFGQVHWTVTPDLARTWRDPGPIPAFARRPVEGGLEEGVCDVVPQFHPLTVSPRESWVTTGEERPADGWKGDLLLARVRWSKPNRL